MSELANDPTKKEDRNTESPFLPNIPVHENWQQTSYIPRSSFTGPDPCTMNQEQEQENVIAYDSADEPHQGGVKLATPSPKEAATERMDTTSPPSPMEEYPAPPLPTLTSRVAFGETQLHPRWVFVGSPPLPPRTIAVPKVSFGEDEPHPRWVLVEASTDPRLTQYATTQSAPATGDRVSGRTDGTGTLEWIFQADRKSVV